MSRTTPGQGGPLQSPISAPPFLQTPQVSTPNFADPFNGNPPINGEFSKPLTNLTLAANLPLPYSQDWDLNIQRSFGSDLLFEIGYVGTKGTKLPRMIEANPAIYIPGFDDEQPTPTYFHLEQRGPAAEVFRMHARSDDGLQLSLRPV